MADPLHIAVDGRELVGKPTGVGRYVAEVLRAWLRGASTDRYSVVVPGPPVERFADPAGRLTWVVEDAGAAGTWWEQTRLRRALTRLSPDVLFAPGYTAPLFASCPTVLVVHDVSFAALPGGFGWRERTRRRLVTRVAAHQASVVATVSEFSRAEIARWLHLPPDRVILAPPGAPDMTLEAERTRPPVVLFVGSLLNRRRIPELMAGFAHAVRQVPDARLVLVGDNRTSPRQEPLELARRLGIGDRVEWHAYVDERALEDFYARARVFAFLSDYEGFGMTPLEALAHGVPPVVLDTPLSREVYGGGARYVALDPASIGAGLAGLLTDAATRQALVAAGRVQLERYSWERTAGILAEALRRAAAR